ncbi:MAG: hypothetical protein RLZZ69_3321, partial [Cyanobacteriota bacterium]
EDVLNNAHDVFFPGEVITVAWLVEPAVLAGGDKLITLKANDITFQNTLKAWK